VCVLVKFLFLLYFFAVLTVRFLIINIINIIWSATVVRADTAV